jgi:hypothetical protein
MPPNTHVTTPLIWTCTGIMLVLDLLLILVAQRFVTREHFRQMRCRLVIASGVFFLLVWASVLLWGWDWFYSYIFPAWARFLLPPLFGIWYTLLALGMSWLSLRLPASPAVTWCLLGGLEGLLSHLYAIYGLGAATKPPIMQGVNQFSVLVFAIFEKAFYWSILLLFCGQLWQLYQRTRKEKLGDNKEKSPKSIAKYQKPARIQGFHKLFPSEIPTCGLPALRQGCRHHSFNRHGSHAARALL